MTTSERARLAVQRSVAAHSAALALRVALVSAKEAGGRPCFLNKIRTAIKSADGCVRNAESLGGRMDRGEDGD